MKKLEIKQLVKEVIAILLGYAYECDAELVLNIVNKGPLALEMQPYDAVDKLPKDVFKKCYKLNVVAMELIPSQEIREEYFKKIISEVMCEYQISKI